MNIDQMLFHFLFSTSEGGEVGRKSELIPAESFSWSWKLHIMVVCFTSLDAIAAF